MFKKTHRTISVYLVLLIWFLSSWLTAWIDQPGINSIRNSLKIQQAEALNKVNNWNFATDASGWTPTNDDGSNVCADNGSATTDLAYPTFGYFSGTFQAITAANKNTNYRGKIAQSVTAPGSGSVKAKGKLTYSSTGSSWSVVNTSWIRLDLYDSSDTTFVASLFCLSFNSNQSATSSFSSDVSLTGGTSYTVRVTMRNRLGSNSVTTTTVDNIVVNFAPTGIAVSAPAGTTNTQLNWTASTAGTGANGLHATTPYKVYRDAGSPVSTFLSNATTNSYTDSSTTGNTTYYYAITDVDTASDESPNSAEVNILTLPDVPGTPTFTNVQSTTLRVNWTAPTGGASSYKIERCTGSGCSNFSQIAAGVTDLYLDETNLSSNTIYRYQVRATNATGDGAYSGIGEITTSVAPIYSVVISPGGTIEYGIIPKGESKSTIETVDTQTITNDGNTTENINIMTSNAVNGTPWTVGSSAGPNVFIHEFSTNSGGNWTKFITSGSYQLLASGIIVDGTIDFDLRVTAPTDSDTQQKIITITIQAVAP